MAPTLAQKAYYTALSVGAFVVASRFAAPWSFMVFGALVFGLMWDGLRPWQEVAILVVAYLVARNVQFFDVASAKTDKGDKDDEMQLVPSADRVQRMCLNPNPLAREVVLERDGNVFRVEGAEVTCAYLDRCDPRRK